jgi:hypothetical protein
MELGRKKKFKEEVQEFRSSGVAEWAMNDDGLR